MIVSILLLLLLLLLLVLLILFLLLLLSKTTKEIFAKICQNTDSDLKVHVLHYANELLVRLRLSFQKLLQTRSTYRKNTKKMFGKRVMMRTRCC